MSFYYFECDNCAAIFDEPEIRTTTYGRYFGAEDPGGTEYRYPVCPACGAEDVSETNITEEEIEMYRDICEANKGRKNRIIETELGDYELNQMRDALKYFDRHYTG